MTLRSAYTVFLLLSVAATAKAQSYSYPEITAAGSKALQKVIPSHLIPATRIYYDPYYLATGTEEEWALLKPGTKTKGKFKKINLRYKLALEHTACEDFDAINAVIELELNERLELVRYALLDSIPDFVLKNLPCPFITRKEAVTIAARNSVQVEESKFWFFNDKHKALCYYGISGNSFSYTDNSGKTVYDTELLEINAETGEVIINTFGQYDDINKR